VAFCEVDSILPDSLRKATKIIIIIIIITCLCKDLKTMISIFKSKVLPILLRCSFQNMGHSQ
jgi:hypothetical protein